jgi:hypothetical protein
MLGKHNLYHALAKLVLSHTVFTIRFFFLLPTGGHSPNLAVSWKTFSPLVPGPDLTVYGFPRLLSPQGEWNTGPALLLH